ncbi:phosphoheptose isomerase [Candidatus Pelagibacter sp.]|jgi:hypothetical protein|nr:phosphoheptose isomerase [Candidatus Pelagibacter sp.]|tara:strand:- start:1478 stop:1825 length:348 start_codon:yes stop_codon:yes gene_type:complete
MKKNIICFDIDGVICHTKDNDYKNSKPNQIIINEINKLYKKNFTIKIFTARFMGRNKENAINAKKQGYQFTKKQLQKWGVKFDKLIMGKPSYDIFIDDKSFNVKANWKKKIRDQF